MELVWLRIFFLELFKVEAKVGWGLLREGQREMGSEESRESSSSAISAKSRVNVQHGREIVSVSVPLPDFGPCSGASNGCRA